MHNSCNQGLVCKQLTVLPFRLSDFKIAAEGLKNYVVIT